MSHPKARALLALTLLNRLAHTFQDQLQDKKAVLASASAFHLTETLQTFLQAQKPPTPADLYAKQDSCRIGARVILCGVIERPPLFQIDCQTTERYVGTVLICDANIVCVKIDRTIRGAEAYDNCVEWYPEHCEGRDKRDLVIIGDRKMAMNDARAAFLADTMPYLVHLDAFGEEQDDAVDTAQHVALAALQNRWGVEAGDRAGVLFDDGSPLTAKLREVISEYLGWEIRDAAARADEDRKDHQPPGC